MQAEIRRTVTRTGSGEFESRLALSRRNFTVDADLWQPDAAIDAVGRALIVSVMKAVAGAERGGETVGKHFDQKRICRALTPNSGAIRRLICLYRYACHTLEMRWSLL
jgi:hypothetical protein